MAQEKDVAANDPAAKPKAPRKKAAAPNTDPEQLAADIERTREELAETLDAIADKVSPKRVAKRTTKKVTDAVKDTAHDAATSVRGTAASAKEKVTGGTTAMSGADRAPDPEPVRVTAPTLVPDRLVTPYAAPASSYESTGPLVKPEYIAAGAAAALLAWLLLRKRK
jgi:hypothetical protein